MNFVIKKSIAHRATNNDEEITHSFLSKINLLGHFDRITSAQVSGFIIITNSICTGNQIND